MAQKTKASAPAEEEAPSKALRRTFTEEEESLPSLPVAEESEASLNEVPEARLRAEVQALLVGVDLTTTTIGELRGRLETKLGLDAGRLASRKSLRRRVCFLVQHEVLKKTQRSAECEILVKELLQLEDYPTPVRQMLIDSLPQAALAVSTEGHAALHPHQLRLLGIVQDAFLEKRPKLQAEVATVEAEFRSAENALRFQDEEIAALVAAEAAAKAASGKTKALVDDNEAELARKEQELESSQAKIAEALKESEQLKEERASILAIRIGPADVLAQGTWGTQQAWWEAFAALQQHLLDTGAESSLLDAATVSLKKLPADRSAFDNMAVNGVTGFLAEQLASADAKLAQRGRVEMEAESSKLSISSLLDAMRARLVTHTEAAANAMAAEAASTGQVESAKAALPQRRNAVVELQASEQKVVEKLRLLDEALSLLDRWISGKEVPGQLTNETRPSEEAAPEHSENREEVPAEEAAPRSENCEEFPAEASPKKEMEAAKEEHALCDKQEMSQDVVMSPRRVPTPMKVLA